MKTLKKIKRRERRVARKLENKRRSIRDCRIEEKKELEKEKKIGKLTDRIGDLEEETLDLGEQETEEKKKDTSFDRSKWSTKSPQKPTKTSDSSKPLTGFNKAAWRKKK